MGALHHQRFDQRRRQEFVAARLPRLAVAVLAEPVASSFADALGERRVEPLGPFKREDQREGGVEMSADANRVGQNLKIMAQASGEFIGERLEIRTPCRPMPSRFEMQVEQPPPALGPLESAAELAAEIVELDPKLVRRERRVRKIRDPLVWVKPVQRQQAPPAVDATVPVEAAEEDWVKLARRAGVFVAEQHVVELVWIFLGHMTQRDGRHARGEVGIEPHRWNPAT